MGQIKFTYPAMLAHEEEMNGFTAVLRGVGADVLGEQAALAGAWVGTTGETYQGWQARWNAEMAELVEAYQAMVRVHEANTLTMGARDLAEGAKWV